MAACADFGESSFVRIIVGDGDFDPRFFLKFFDELRVGVVSPVVKI